VRLARYGCMLQGRTWAGGGGRGGRTADREVKLIRPSGLVITEAESSCK